MNVRCKKAILFLSVLHLLACQKQELSQESVQYTFDLDQFSNTLDVSGEPSKQRDRSVSSFSDLGSWHSYSLSKEPSGGFIGPFLMTDDNGLWSSSQLVALNLWINDEPVDWKNAQILESKYLPGRLSQSYRYKDVTVIQQLIFISNRSTLVQYEIMSTTKLPKVKVNFTGETWLEGWHFEAKDDTVSLTSKESQTHVEIVFEEGFGGSADQQTFLGEKNDFDLNPNFPVKINYIQSAYFSDEEKLADQENVRRSLDNPAWSLANNKKRWYAYVDKTLTKKNDQPIDSAYNFLAVKSLNTLVNNWRSAAGELKHDGLFPSYAYGGFHGFWAWDSWKHAVGLADIIPELAKDQIRAMYDFQDIDGMIADCVFRDTLIENHNWRDTKPPLSGWAIAKVFEVTKDTSFVQELFPKLKKYHQWWYNFRDHDGNKLCEYGSTDGTRIAAAWESGMDNAVRFDEAKMLSNPNGGFSLDQESVDLNAYLYHEKKVIAQLAQIVEPASAEEFSEEASDLRELIQSKFYQSEEGYFFDVMHDGKIIKIYGPEGWTPLWTEIATQEQASKVIEQMMNADKFNTKVPLPTLEASHPEFNPQNGYWRGPVWLDQVYFGIRGLENYGQTDQADKLKKKLIQNAEGLLTSEPIRENYHPLTGEGLNARHFSWSAAHMLLLIRE